MTISEIIKFVTDNLTVIIGILTPIFGLIGGFCKWMHSLFADVRTTKKLVEKIEPMLKDLEAVKLELKSNGGSSVKDAVTRIEAKINSIEFAQHLTWDYACQIPMFHSDTHGNCTWVNKSYLNMVKRPIQELVGFGWETCVAYEDRERVCEEWYESCSKNRAFDMIYSIIDLDGKTTKVRCQARGDEKIGFIGFLYKID